MAQYKTDENFNVIEATGVDGKTVALNVEHGDALMRNAFMPMPKTKKYTVGITDVTGAKDGANSVAHMRWRRRLTAGEQETVRLKETPDELRKVFGEACVHMPKVKKSWGLIGREIKAAIFGGTSPA